MKLHLVHQEKLNLELEEIKMRNKMKSVAVMVMSLVLTGAVLTGCGESQQETKPDNVQNIIQETKPDNAEVKTEAGAAEIMEVETKDETVRITEEYEDNFAVDSKAAKEFAEKVKDVTAKKDLEGLAALTAFPVYVGLPGVDVVETKEDFLKLGAEAVFTQELLESVEKADIDNFQSSMAGFSISDGGTSNINFGVVDKVLAINGINY